MIADILRRTFWIVAMFAAVLAGGIATLGLGAAESAIQECSVASVSLAIAVVPYCLARAVSELLRDD